MLEVHTGYILIGEIIFICEFALRYGNCQLCFLSLLSLCSRLWCCGWWTYVHRRFFALGLFSYNRDGFFYGGLFFVLFCLFVLRRNMARFVFVLCIFVFLIFVFVLYRLTLRWEREGDICNLINELIIKEHGENEQADDEEYPQS